MQYSNLVDLYESLDSTTKKLEKRDILAEFLRDCPEDLINRIVLLTMGSVYPKASKKDLGVAGKMMRQTLLRTTGAKEQELVDELKDKGDLGLVAEELVKNKRQQTLKTKRLEVRDVFENIRSLAETTGKGSQDRKISILSELISSARPDEAKYIVRTVLGTMRTGVAEGIMRDAISEAFEINKKKVERAYHLTTDYGETAEIIKREGEDGLDNIKMEVGNPIKAMLATPAGDMDEVFDKFDNVAFEVKYDGFRAMINKDGDDIKLFSRRLEELSKQFPDVVELARKHIKADKAIVDTEVVAIDKKTGMALPFQKLSKRIKRKYDIEKTAKEIPIRVNAFDILNVEGENLMDLPLIERIKALERTVEEGEEFLLADRIVTDDKEEAQKFLKEAVAKGEEGLIAKNLDAKYQPGKRVGYWLKVKEILEPLDLVIVGAEWGEGKRAKWLSSYILAAQGENGELTKVGRMASGLTEEELEEMTKTLEELVIGKGEGKVVEVKPEVIVEVGYEEIQKSPKYDSGYALRFPRMLRIRTEEKDVSDINTLEEIERIYDKQRGRN